MAAISVVRRSAVVIVIGVGGLTSTRILLISQLQFTVICIDDGY